MPKKQTRKIILITIVAFILRLIIAPLINRGDVLIHYDWSKVLYHIGLNKAYFYPIWTYTNPPTQPPAMLLLFWLSRHLYQNRYLLSQLHNLIKIPPAFLILWFDRYGEFILIKIWAILADIAGALIVYHLVKKISRKPKLALISLIFFLFNPIAIFESAIWGQNDILAALLALSAFIMLQQKQNLLAPGIYLLSIMIKPIALILAPLFVAFYLKNCLQHHHGLKKIIPSALIALCLFVLLFLPFINSPSGFIPQVHSIIKHRISPFSKGPMFASVSAFNLYYLLFPLTPAPLGLNLKLFNILSILIINLFFIKTFLKNHKMKLVNLIFLIFLVSQASFLFIPNMLERYFLLGLIPATIVLFTHPQLKFFLLLQNLCWFINLFYSFFHPHIHWVNQLFWTDHYYLIRLLSLINIVIFFRLLKFFINHQKELCLKNR